MPVPPNVRVCTHIKVSGVRCGSPALRGEQFCYFHQRAVRGVRTPPQSRLHPIALIEDEQSIQYALMEVINALMRNTIDLKRATLVLRALHIAVKNARYARFDIHASQMVKEVPDYPPSSESQVGAADGPSGAAASELEIPAESRPPVVRPTSAEIDRRKAEMIAHYYGTTTSQPAAAPGQAASSAAHVGTDAQACPEQSRGGCPGGPAVPGRGATAQGSARPQTSMPTQNSANKKPPLPVNQTLAPKARKSAAHRASGG